MDPITLGIMASLAAVMQVMQGFMGWQQNRSAGNSAKAAGVYQQQLANVQAQRLEQQAKAEAATGQRKAIEQKRVGQLVSSRTRALAAASGADLSSPSVVSDLGDIESEASYRAAVARYEGDTAAQGLQYQAALERTQGLNARIAGRAAKHIAYAQANQKLLSGFLSAGGTIGTAAAGGAFGGGGEDPGFESQLGTAGGFGNQSILQQQVGSGSPLFQRYGAGGVGASTYP